MKQVFKVFTREDRERRA